jgi:hypothetical protein
MKPIEALVEQSYYVRVAIIGLITAGLGALLMLLSQRSWAKTFDGMGVTRRDERQFQWSDLKNIRYVHVRGVLNHVELIFYNGKAMIFPLMLKNGGEVMSFISRLPGAKPASQH